MFDLLSSRLNETFRKLRSRGFINEKDIDETLREIRLALLEADVNFKVVKDFISNIRGKIEKTEITKSLTPSQQIIKIVHDELVELLGNTPQKVSYSSKPPTIFMLVGLQGSGKTSTAAKLAYFLKKQNKKTLLIAADIYRPAAIDQLKTLCEEISVPFFSLGPKTSPVEIARKGVSEASSGFYDAVILDTAGRLHIDKEMLDELLRIKQEVHPHYILLVVDAMTGQDAVNIASSFNEQVGIDGLIMTKLDGDARGGAALSVKSITGKPIYFASFGEKSNSLQIFYPDRIASRILGFGDVLTLVEKAEEVIDLEKAKQIEDKLKKQELTLEDFLSQIEDLRKMGPVNQIFEMLPGLDKLKSNDTRVDEKYFVRTQAIIQSMTPEERKNSNILNGNRRARIAQGSGVTIQDVNQLLKQFEQMRKIVKQFGKINRVPFGKKFFPFMK